MQMSGVLKEKLTCLLKDVLFTVWSRLELTFSPKAWLHFSFLYVSLHEPKILFTDGLSIHLNADITLVTVPLETLESLLLCQSVFNDSLFFLILNFTINTPTVYRKMHLLWFSAQRVSDSNDAGSTSREISFKSLKKVLCMFTAWSYFETRKSQTLFILRVQCILGN